VDYLKIKIIFFLKKGEKMPRFPWRRKKYKVDLEKVKTVEDIVAIIKAMKISLDVDEESAKKIEHLIEEK
jgi:hypothetical protein